MALLNPVSDAFPARNLVQAPDNPCATHGPLFSVKSPVNPFSLPYAQSTLIRSARLLGLKLGLQVKKKSASGDRHNKHVFPYFIIPGTRRHTRIPWDVLPASSMRRRLALGTLLSTLACCSHDRDAGRDMTKPKDKDCCIREKKTHSGRGE